MQKLQLLVAAATMFALVGVVAAPAAAQNGASDDAKQAQQAQIEEACNSLNQSTSDDTTIACGQRGSGAFVFAQQDDAAGTGAGAGGGTFVRTDDGAVVYDGDAGAVANDEFTAFGTGAYVSPFFVGAGAGGGSTAVGFTGAGCGVPTLSPTDAECNVG